MRPPFCRMIFWAVVMVCLISRSPVVEAQVPHAQRFQARFVDGSDLNGDEIRNWHETDAEPLLSEKPLFDSENRVRSVIDTTLPLGEAPDAGIEFVGGDFLPGDVTGSATGNESPYDRQPPHLFVDRQPWVLPNVQSTHPLRIQTRWVRRVIWKRRAHERYQPGTLFLVDGRRFPFRAVRWNGAGVAVLLEQSAEEFPFHDLAEIHLPATDAWTGYLEQLALLNPAGTGDLFQWETVQGLRATGSRSRFQARSHGNQHDPAAWWHLIQPAWSLDPLWVSHRLIRVRRFFQTGEVPLTVLDPVRSEHGPGFSRGTHWQRNRNVYGGALMSGGHEFAWGIGVQAEHELEYRLPAGTLAFESFLGLDAISRTGGCARGLIYAGQKSSEAAFRSELLIGSANVRSTGQVNLHGRERLQLVADSATSDRPPGADPFDIRDTLDWLEPLLFVHPQQLQEQVLAATTGLMPAWDGWELRDAPSGPVQFHSHWSGQQESEARYISEIEPRLPFVTIARDVRISPQQTYLVLAVSRLAEDTVPGQLQVRADQRSLGEFPVPVRNSADVPEPIVVPLQEFAGRQIRLEITHLSSSARSRLDWRAITFTAHPPGILPVVSDQPAELARWNQGEGQLRLDEVTGYDGIGALKVSLGTAGNPQLFTKPIRIRQQPQLGEFRYLRFVWKKPMGTPIMLQLAADGRWGDRDTANERLSFRYDAGTGARVDGNTRRIADQLPAEWVVVDRDLVGDWGEFNLTGFAFGSSDSEPAWLDHVYLARTPRDLDRLLVDPHASRRSSAP